MRANVQNCDPLVAADSHPAAGPPEGQPLIWWLAFTILRLV